VLYLRRIVGDSMLPTLRADQLVVLVRSRRPRAGDVVMVRHDGREKIKRVAKVADGQLFLLGDNPAASTDSRQFGWLPMTLVVARLPRRGRMQPHAAVPPVPPDAPQ
jgi:nickel-type superoxide dismutase maturation protease